MSVDRNGFPNEIGIELTPEAFKNLTDEEDTKVLLSMQQLLFPCIL